MNFLQALRMQNIFGPTSMIGSDLPSQGGITGNMPMPSGIPMGGAPSPMPPMNMPPSMSGMDMPVTAGLPSAGPSPDDYDVAKRMSQLYHPQTDAEDAYNAMIKQYPQDKGHSKLARIGAALLGGVVGMDNPIAGYRFGKGLLDEGRNSAIEDWKNKIGPMQQSANLERQGNVNERTTAYQTINEELKAKAQDAKAQNDTRKADIAEKRASAYQYKIEHPNAKFDFSGPTVLAADPVTKKVTDTGIPTGHLTDSDKISLQGSERIKQIDESGKQTRETNAQKGWAIGTVPDPNDPTKQIGVRYNIDTGKVEPITFGGTNNMTSPGAPGATLPGGQPQGAGSVTSPSGGPPMQSSAPSGGPAIPAGTPILTPALGAKQANDIKVKEQQLAGIRQRTQNTLDDLKDLLNDKGELTSKAAAAVGKSYPLGYIPTTEAYTGRVSINHFKAEQILSLIGEMKAQSKTGATGFGQLSGRELTVLENAANRLDTGLSEEDFRDELKTIKEKLDKVMQPENGLNPTAVNRKLTAEELIAKYGGR